MQNSSIEWTDHTFNPWWGCIRVSPGCEHCYAETLANRYGHAVWGPAKTTPRRMMSENYWRQPLKWNEQARQAGKRARVFCASMADVFEDHPGVVEARLRLWALIEQTPNLDWLLLTKRPENIEGMVPRRWLEERQQNVWFGFSAENQEYFNRRWSDAKYMARRGYIVFGSCEPLLGPINLNPWNGYDNYLSFKRSWIITGGESGPGARPCWPEWVRSIRDQCQAAGVAYLHKQWGEYEPYEEDAQPPFWNDQHGRCIDGHGLDILNPETGDVNPGWHEDSLHSPYAFRRVGKHAAGRLLDGVEHNGFPS